MLNFILNATGSGVVGSQSNNEWCNFHYFLTKSRNSLIILNKAAAKANSMLDRPSRQSRPSDYSGSNKNVTLTNRPSVNRSFIFKNITSSFLAKLFLAILFKLSLINCFLCKFSQS
ncbi:hypothetical protein BpHYR1_034430 [Brachionus plicatilis]|uniref:Uncharacterized protein n=1 Tax=Brachionus plicatilis TaxID=10195 RepID=A0A3M7TBM2_BRAPC|nr:hypothetical protein BpHYR1_034430 [Brachionus plicatilis]